MSHSNTCFLIHIYILFTISTIPYKNGDSNTTMIILWYWNSCTMVFTSQGKFKTTIVVLLQIFTKTKVMYNALTKSTMVLPCYSWKYLGLPWAPGPKERSKVIWSMSATSCLPSHPLRLWHLFSVSDLFQTNALNGKVCMLHLPKYCQERSPARVLLH